jgi:hypothetical protein
MKLSAMESRILAHTDTRILLTKLDAVLRETQQVGIDMQSQIQCLHLSKQELLLRLSEMVPVSELNSSQAELNSSQAEAGMLREDIKRLNQLLRGAHVEIDDLQCSMKVQKHNLTVIICL